MEIVYALVVGGVAGWIAGILLKGKGFGILGNIVVGILGGIVGRYLLPAIGVTISGGTLGVILNATIGALVIFFVAGLLFGKKT